MEHFFYNDNYYEDLESFINDLFEDDSEIHELEDDKLFICKGSKKEPIVEIDAYWIAERIDEDRFSENGVDNEVETIMKALNSNINFDEINKLIPCLYYENYKDKFTISKNDLLEFIK